MKTPERDAADPQQPRQCEMLEICKSGEWRAYAGQHGDKSRRNSNPQRPGPALLPQVVPAVREGDSGSDGEDQ